MPDSKGKKQKNKIFEGNEAVYQKFSKFTPHRGVPKVFNLEKKPRQSTDLEEYVFKAPKNFT